MKITEVTKNDKKGVPRIRFTLDVTRGEALLLKEAVDGMFDERSSVKSWDASSDAAIMGQMQRRMEMVV